MLNEIKESLSVQLVIATGIPAVRSGVRIQAVEQHIFESQQRARHFYLLRSFLFNEYRFFFTGGGGHYVYNPPISSGGLTNGWSYISNSPIRLDGVDKDLAFLFTSAHHKNLGRKISWPVSMRHASIRLERLGKVIMRSGEIRTADFTNETRQRYRFR